jgi:hypothetical protein
VAEKTKEHVVEGQFNIFPEATVSELGAPLIFLTEKASTRISPYSILKNNIDGATVYKDQLITIEMIKIPIPEESKTPEDFSHGPSTHANQYNPNRDIFRFTVPDKEVFIWTSIHDNIFMTQLNRNALDHSSIKLESKKDFILAAATGDAHHVFYIIVQKGEGPNKLKGIPMFIIKADRTTGKVVKE